MGRCIKLGILVCLILTIHSSAKTDSLKTYTLNPVDKSMPTYNDTGDRITNNLQAWFAFDLSGIPDTAQIVSATFSAYIWNVTEIPSQRQLWYYSDDSWIFNPSEDLSDPGDDVTADQIVGTLWHDDPDYERYKWKTITITYDDWTRDIADGYISLMLTDGQYGAVGLDVDYAWDIDKAPELFLTVVEKPDNVYTNLFDLGPEEFVKANNLNISVGNYSVPSSADWNNDGLKDLIIGTGAGNVRIYLNIGTNSEPQFTESNNKSFYAQADGADLYCSPSGCMGCFPRVVYWDADKKKDLLVGQAEGSIKIFLNINTDADPKFDNGTLLEYIYESYTTYIDVGNRATPTVVDWNNDGRKDLVVGALDGKIHIFINDGTDTEPFFPAETSAIEDNFNLYVPSGRSSPVILDLDFDGKKDILTGNTNGQLLLYINTGTDEEPEFSGYEAVDANGIEIDLSGTPRSRPFVCYWDKDGYPDVLLGAGDGKVHLYRCKTVQADFDKDGDIDFRDYAMFASYWKKAKYADKQAADLNNDGKVDIDDLSWIAANWLLKTNNLK